MLLQNATYRQASERLVPVRQRVRGAAFRPDAALPHVDGAHHRHHRQKGGECGRNSQDANCSQY